MWTVAATLVVTHQLQVERRQGKFAGQRPTVPLHQLSRYLNFLKTECRIGRGKHPFRKSARFVQTFRQNTDL